MKKHSEPSFDIQSLSDSEAQKVLSANRIALSPAEARYFQKEIGRPLTLTELTVLGIQGSEHCSYRSTRQYLKQLPTKGKNVILGPGEDSGIVEIAKETPRLRSGQAPRRTSRTRSGQGKRWGLVMSHESHNHPSQVVPYEGAATGVGGIVRDILCMGARVIGVLDCLRFGNIDKHLTGWLTREVVEGIAGYGNPLGVPNVGGDLEYNPSFDSNCLVNVVALGVLREDEIIHSFVPAEAARVGYDIIIVGKATDRSGFGGASFASADLREEDAEANKGAVQEPNPFLERHLLVSSYDLFAELKKRKLLNKVSFKDMGAGGNVCASVEQVAKLGFGAEIDLEKIHVGEENLPPHIIAAAETQERFCWICHPKVTKLILDTYNKKWALPKVSKGARASVVGKVKKGNYVLRYRGTKVIDAPAQILTEGLLYNRPVEKKPREFPSQPLDFEKLNWPKVLRDLLKSENIASRRPIYEKYDKQVQGGTVVDTGHGSGAIIQPLINTQAPEELKKIGITIGHGGSSSLGAYSAKLQAAHAVAEAVANVVITGATPLALTDCLNYGNPEKPLQMGEFADGIAGLKEMAETLKLPFISGNVSLYNNNGRDSINPSALVACAGKLKDASKSISQKFQKAGNLLILVGKRSANLGGSEFEKATEQKLGSAFELDSKDFGNQVKFILKAAQKNLIASARDLHRGGVLIATAESAFGTTLGAKLENLNKVELVAENPGFLLEITPENLKKIEMLATEQKVKITQIGQVSAESVFEVEPFLREPTKELEKIWEESLREILRN